MVLDFMETDLHKIIYSKNEVGGGAFGNLFVITCNGLLLMVVSLLSPRSRIPINPLEVIQSAFLAAW